MEIQEISTLLLMYVNVDDVVGARSLLEGVNEKDRKSIVAKSFDCNPPLFVAVMRGNVDMVECLVTEWQADMEELGGFMNLVDNTRHHVTPLCFAGVLNHLEVMNLLINLGADINAFSDTGYTPMLYACKMMHVDVVRSLVCNGADVQKPNNYGETSLMVAVDQCCEEICEILLKNGAEVNARCFLSENTALHRAIAGVIYPSQEAIVKLLIDHGADPYLTNAEGDDAFRKASLEANEPILKQLLFACIPPVERWIESYKLLGASYVINNDNEKALSCWENVVDLRLMYILFDFHSLQPNPIYLYAQEMNTSYDLKRISMSLDSINMHVLMILEQILGPHHYTTISGLSCQSQAYRIGGEYRRCIEVCKYALQLQNTGSNPLISGGVYRCFNYMATLYYMSYFYCEFYSKCQQPNSMNNVVITFEELLEVLQMVTTNTENTTGIIISHTFENYVDVHLILMKLVLHLISLVTKLEMNSDQQVRFKQIVDRLVRCQLQTEQGQTLLHLSVLQCTSHVDGKFFGRDDIFFSPFPNTAVVQLLLECGATVNANDEHTASLTNISRAMKNSKLGPYHGVLAKTVITVLNNSTQCSCAVARLTSTENSLEEMIYSFRRSQTLPSCSCCWSAAPPSTPMMNTQTR